MKILVADRIVATSHDFPSVNCTIDAEDMRYISSLLRNNYSNTILAICIVSLASLPSVVLIFQSAALALDDLRLFLTKIVLLLLLITMALSLSIVFISLKRMILRLMKYFLSLLLKPMVFVFPLESQRMM